jgi:hypothetical protein
MYFFGGPGHVTVTVITSHVMMPVTHDGDSPGRYSAKVRLTSLAI